MARSFINPPIYMATPDNIMNNAPAVFAADLVFFLAREFEIRWTPTRLPNYCIRELSPFDLDMQDGAMKLVRHKTAEYNAKYEALVNPEAEDKLGQFVDYARLVLSTVVDEDRNVAYIFLHIVYIARLSLVFYERGTREAPDFASILISHAMVQLAFKTDGQIYRILSNFAARVTEEMG